MTPAPHVAGPSKTVVGKGKWGKNKAISSSELGTDKQRQLEGCREESKQAGKYLNSMATVVGYNYRQGKKGTVKI